MDHTNGIIIPALPKFGDNSAVATTGPYYHYIITPKRRSVTVRFAPRAMHFGVLRKDLQEVTYARINHKFVWQELAALMLMDAVPENWQPPKPPVTLQGINKKHRRARARVPSKNRANKRHLK